MRPPVLLNPMQDCQWVFTDLLREFAFRLYGGPATTKFILEDAFNHLRHVSGVQNKGRSHMAKSTQYFYASTCPTLKTSHLPTPEVDFQQFQAAFAMGLKRIRPQESATLPELGEQLRSKPLARHKPGDHPLPTEFPDKKALLKLDRDWKPAGYLSNRVATAACFYLMEDRATKWKNACNAWAGTREQEKKHVLTVYCSFFKCLYFHR